MSEVVADRESARLLSLLDDPRSIQEQRLLDHVLQPNRDCEFGREHCFSSLRSVNDFRSTVPIRSYEDFRPWIDRMMEGTPELLVREPVRHFFLTSGSTSAPKYVPVTRSFVRDKSRAFGAFWGLVRSRHPRASGQLVTNFADIPSVFRTSGGIPASSETSYWSRMTAATAGKGGFVVPREIDSVVDWNARYYVLGRLLVEREFSVIMSLNPSTILLLLQELNRHADRLIEDIRQGTFSPPLPVAAAAHHYVESECRPDRQRAGHLHEALARDSLLTAGALWPELRLLVSWRSPVLEPYLQQLGRHAPAISHDDYVSMASEGVLAIPIEGDSSGGVVAVDSHFYEFIPEREGESRDPDTLLAHELEQGQRYEIVLTTSAGLYRYRLGDIVRVRGFRGRTPIIEFLYRAGATCSLTGEKLTEAQVSESVAQAARRLQVDVTEFTAIPSERGFPHYVFLVELPGVVSELELERFLAEVDRELGACNLEYRAKRETKRLGAPELWRVTAGGYAAFRKRRVEAGANAAQLKPAFLKRDSHYHEQFEVESRLHAPDVH